MCQAVRQAGGQSGGQTDTPTGYAHTGTQVCDEAYDIYSGDDDAHVNDDKGFTR